MELFWWQVVEDVPLEVSLESLQPLFKALGDGGCMSGFTFQPEGLCADFFPFNFATTPSGPWFPHCRGFTIKLRHITLGRTPLDEWSARRRYLYLTRHTTLTRDRHPAGFELAIPASERPQTHALDSAATGLYGDSALKYTATASTCFPIQQSAPSRRIV